MRTLLMVLMAIPFVGAGEKDQGRRHRGVSWVGSRRAVVDDVYYRSLVEHHINWIVQTPFGWQKRYDEPDLKLNESGGFWGESDEGIRVTTRLSQKYGVKTMLKPHIWLNHRNNDGKWRADIAMKSEADWDLWFANYRTYITHYARLADELGIEALCVGMELHATVKREKQWREIIRAVRAVYSGQLTYAANWYKEYQQVAFWDQLDYVGIQAYFPLAKKENPSVAELVSGWQPHLSEIVAFQKKVDKPIIFTEVGYRNTANSAIEPWLWPERPRYEKLPEGGYRVIPNPDLQLDASVQADAFRALFQVFWHKPWFEGLYVWKWFPDRMNGEKPDSKRLWGETFSPQHQPAMAVIKDWYGK